MIAIHDAPAETTVDPGSLLAWFVLVVRSHQEAKVLTALEEIAVEAWFPCEVRWKRTPKVKTRIYVPLIVGYVFIGLDDPDDAWPHILQIEGVNRVIGGASPRRIEYGGPRSDFHHADRAAPRTLWDLRAMEAMGAFDLTKDAKASANAKKATVILHSLAALGPAMAS